ncbi:MAG: DNA polymerase III subunit [Clostridia bacterium]|nr:DNA polymerase III subunit [Clostridia bacterium]
MGEIFSALYGNKATKKRLGAAIVGGTLPHAFLISGPEGSGKLTLAKEISAALNCERTGSDSALPCHRCNSCRRIAEEGFTDVKILRKPKDKATIGVGEVRYFREDMFLSATESDKRIYIITDADKMTPNAQNALLKVIEEPPLGVYIMLLSASDDAILTTIKSRTQHIAMERFDEEELASYLGRTGERDRELLMSADGCIGRAKELFSDGGEDTRAARRTSDAVLSAIKPSVPYSELYTAIKELPTKKDELIQALEMLTVALRDLMLMKHDKSAPLLYFTARERAGELAAAMTAKRLNAIYDVIRSTVDELMKNVNVTAVVTSLGARIKLI